MAKTKKKTKTRKGSSIKNKVNTNKQNKSLTSGHIATPKIKNKNNKVKKEKVVKGHAEKDIKPIVGKKSDLIVKSNSKQLELKKNKSNASKIAKIKKNRFEKRVLKYLRKIKMYGIFSVVPKKYFFTAIFTILTLIVAITSISYSINKNNLFKLASIPDKIDQIKTVSFDIDDSNDIVTSSHAYSGLKDYYEYDFDKVFNLDKTNVDEYVIKYNKSNNEVFIVIKPNNGKLDDVKKTFDDFMSSNKISNYLYKEYQGYLIYIKSNNSDNDALILSKIMQSNIRVFSILQELKKDDIEKNFGIKESYYDEALVKTSMLRSDTCEYVIIKPKNANAKSKIKNAMNEHYAGLESKWQGKNEKNYNLVVNRYYGEYQGYLIYIVSNDNNLVMDLIKG
jgi:hypothetical protein